MTSGAVTQAQADTLDRDFARAVTDLAHRRIRGYESSRDDWNQASALKRLIGATKQEYEERFLFELIQNGYDAHPAGESGGRVDVLLDRTEGEHGVLYVANAGQAFTASNLEAITQLAQSDKDPQDSIGNKGVGFKSVLRICDWPEIYSCAPDASAASEFDGYCFTFARPEDMLRLVDEDPLRAERVGRDVSPYFLPVPLSHARPPTVESFAAAGLSTVVRLPLRTPEAADVASRRLRELLDGQVPVHLFLDKLARLVLTDRGRQGDEAVDLTRRVTEVGASPDGLTHFVRTDLGRQGEWFVACRTVPRTDVRRAVLASIEGEQLDPAWASWDADATVSVAVRTDEGSTLPRTYTYLPMGEEAVAPLHGHLHAPFSTKLARTSVDERVTYNDLLLRAAARASASAVLAFAHRPDVLPPSSVVDLFAWTRRHDLVQDAFSAEHASLGAAEVIPLVELPEGPRTGSLASTFTWAHPAARLVTARRVAASARAHLVLDELDDERVGRLQRLAISARQTLQPSATQEAGWLEVVAEELRFLKRPAGTWNRFYDDLAVVMAEYPDALRGRRVLLGADGELHAVPADRAADGLQPLVFFPGARTRTSSDEDIDPEADVTVPPSLRRTVVQMHDDLSWTQRRGSSNPHTRARRFLEDERLVRGYKAADLLEHLGRILESRFTEARGRDALRYSYAIAKAARQLATADIRSARLRVPTAAGWVPAESAVFSGGWGTELGERLDALVDDPTAPDDLVQVGRRRVLAPGTWPHPPDVEAFAAFLQRAGVRDGLWPRPIRWYRDLTVRDCKNPWELRALLQVSASVQGLWVERVEAHGAWPALQQAKYRPRPLPGNLPGLSEHAALSTKAKEAFAVLVVAGLQRWGGQELEIRWARTRHTQHGQRDDFRWPSPLRVQLEELEWLPITDKDRSIAFVRPNRAWSPGATSPAELPREVPAVSARIRAELNRSPEAASCLKTLGVRVWDVPESAADVLDLLALMGTEAAELNPRLARAYADAWHLLLRDATAGVPEQLLLRRQGRHTSSTTGAATKVVVMTSAGSYRQPLLHFSTLSVLVAHPEDGAAIAARLPSGLDVVRAEDLQLRLRNGEQTLRATSDAGAALLEVYPHVRMLVALLLETSQDRFVRVGLERRRELLETLGRVRIRPVDDFELEIEGSMAVLPARIDVLPLVDGLAPSLFVRGGATLTGSDLVPALVELLHAPYLREPLQNALLRFERTDAIGIGPKGLALALDLDESRVDELLRHLERDVTQLAALLAPVVAAQVSLAAGLVFAEDSAQSDPELDLHQLLSSHVGTEHAEGLIALAQHHLTPGSLRDALGLEFRAFNAALVALDEVALAYPEEHEQAMRQHVHRHGPALRERLRRRHFATARAGGDLRAYVEATQLTGIQPDPAWLATCRTPSQDMLSARLDAWLDRVADTPEEESLVAIEDARRRNYETVRELAASARPKILAWMSKRGLHVDGAWTGDDRSEPAHLLAEAGRLDFDLLNEGSVLTAMRGEGLLPAEFPRSLDLETLGLLESEIASAEDDAASVQRERRRRARVVSLDGEEFDASPDGLEGLADRVRASISETLLGRSKRFTTLEVFAAPARDKRQTPDGRVGRGRNLGAPERMSDVQRSAVGLAGEVVAFEWLKRKYPGEALDTAWRSSYARRILLTSDSNDDLGYDFEIVQASKMIYFEVKATVGDRTQFDLGASEVAMARQCATGRDDYRIVFVSHVLDSARRAISVLPNPLHRNNRTVYDFPGAGLRVAFRPAM